MQEHCNEKVIIYFLTCASVDFFFAALSQLPQMATAQLHALHGKMKQQAREATMTAYSTGTAGRLGLSLRPALIQHGCLFGCWMYSGRAALPCQLWLGSNPQ